MEIVNYVCQECGKSIEGSLSVMKRRKFCSRECYGNYKSKNCVGENNNFYGKHISDERKEKLSELRKGKKLSDEIRQKMSDSKKGEKNYNFGKHKSDETKEKLRLSHIGLFASEDTKRKMSESRTGKILSDSHRLHISEAKKGEKNPSYIHGNRRQKYCYKFFGKDGVRSRSLIFFNHMCMECGKTDDENKLNTGHGLHVHHVYYRKMSCCEDEQEYDCGIRKIGNTLHIKEANGEINNHEIEGKHEKFAVLCSSCHGKTTTMNRHIWIKYYENRINNNFDGKSFLSMEEYNLFLENK